MKLTGKIALITNVSHFMGPAITEEFCREGASVALHDRDEAAVKPYAAIAERLGRDVLSLTGDLSRSGEAERAVAAVVARFGRLDLDDLQSEKAYGAMRTYGRSKFANIAFTFELARRLEGTGVSVNCVHPGAVGTRLGKNNGAFGRIVTGLLRPFFLSPRRGAATSLHVATADSLDGVSGRYFAKQREATPLPETRDPELARRLWDESARLTGVGA